MRNLIRLLPVVAALLIGAPIATSAGPCVPSTLADYLSLASGCSIGTALFSDFTSEAIPFGAEAIASDTIQVVPFSGAGTVGLQFVFDRASGAGLVDTSFSYVVSGASISGAGLTMAGADAPDFGTVTGLEQICEGAAFVLANCSGAPDTMIVFLVGGIDSDFDEAVTLAAAQSLLGVLNDIGFDGGGSLAPGSVTNSFTLDAGDTTGGTTTGGTTGGTTTTGSVPEPALTALFVAGLAGLARRRSGWSRR